MLKCGISGLVCKLCKHVDNNAMNHSNLVIAELDAICRFRPCLVRVRPEVAPKETCTWAKCLTPEGAASAPSFFHTGPERIIANRLNDANSESSSFCTTSIVREFITKRICLTSAQNPNATKRSGPKRCTAWRKGRGWRVPLGVGEGGGGTMRSKVSLAYSIRITFVLILLAASCFFFSSYSYSYSFSSLSLTYESNGSKRFRRSRAIQITDTQLVYLAQPIQMRS